MQVEDKCIYIYIHIYIFTYIYIYICVCIFMQVEDFKATFGGNVPMGPVTLVKELEEEEDFWEYFVLG